MHSKSHDTGIHPSCLSCKPMTRHELILMTLRRGEERLHIKHPVIKLNPTDAKEIACLMRQADPEWWGETASQRIIEGMDERLWLGIKVDGKLCLSREQLGLRRVS